MPKYKLLSTALFVLACNPSPDTTTDAGNDAGGDVVAACPATTGPTMHPAGSLTADETWSAAASPHVVQGDVTIPKGKTLTIEPCATVQVAEGHYFYVNGSLVADGTTTQPITIGPQTAGTRWASIEIDDPGPVDLAFVTISGGGDLPNSTLGTTIRGNGTTATGPSPILKVANVTITDSAGFGIDLSGLGAFIDGSHDLVISSSGIADPGHPYPITINTQAATSIPSGTYTGNGKDEIQIHADSPRALVDVDVTLHDRGVPYHVGGGGANNVLEVGKDGGLATLTIDPNVTLRFEPGGQFVIGHYSNNNPPEGVLVAQGTAQQHITFTSAAATPAPGDWMGLLFTNSISGSDMLAYVDVDYAGGSCSCVVGCIPQNMTSDAAIIFFNQPSSGMITNTTISHSAMHGIDRAWDGASTPSFLGAVTFNDIKGCHETVPRDQNNACPSSIPCP
jgi:hypothetical protein